MTGMTNAAFTPGIEVQPGATRVQLFPGYGTWYGRNGAGPYSIADRAQAAEIIAATQTAQGSTDLMFDYDHQAALAPAVAGTAIAAGWFRDLSADDRGIWAEGVRWTATASARLAAREYRYASPYFLHDKAGRITRILNAGLTNTPNFDMDAVAASASLSLGSARAITAAERQVIDRMGITPAAYLASRAERDQDEASAAASIAQPGWGGQLTAGERDIIHRLGITPAAFLASRAERDRDAAMAGAFGTPSERPAPLTSAERDILERLAITPEAYIAARGNDAGAPSIAESGLTNEKRALLDQLDVGVAAWLDAFNAYYMENFHRAQ